MQFYGPAGKNATLNNCATLQFIDTPNTRTYVLEFTSYDAGATVWANYIGYFE